MIFLFEVLQFGRLIIVLNPTLPTISFYICDFVDAKSMLLVYWSAVYVLASCDGLLRCLVFDEGEPELISSDQKFTYCVASLPFGLTLFIDRHKETIILDLSTLGIQPPGKKFLQLGLICFRHFGQAVNNNKGI